MAAMLKGAIMAVFGIGVLIRSDSQDGGGGCAGRGNYGDNWDSCSSRKRSLFFSALSTPVG